MLYAATKISKFGHKPGEIDIQSVLMQWEAEKLGVQPRQQRVKITAARGASVICQTDKVNLWLLDEKHMSVNLNPKRNPETAVHSL